LNQLKEILSRYRGNCPAYVNLSMNDCELVLALSKDYHLEPSSELVQEVDSLFGSNVVGFEA